MTDPTPIDPREEWELKVEAESMAFVKAVRHNWLHGLKTSMDHLPKLVAPEVHRVHLHRQLDYFIDAMIGVAVDAVAHWASPVQEMEDRVVDDLRSKFKYIRDHKTNERPGSGTLGPSGVVPIRPGAPNGP